MKNNNTHQPGVKTPVDILWHVAGQGRGTQTPWTQELHMCFVWGFDSCGQAAITTENFPCEIQSLFLELVDREKLPKKLAHFSLDLWSLMH